MCWRDVRILLWTLDSCLRKKYILHPTHFFKGTVGHVFYGIITIITHTCDWQSVTQSTDIFSFTNFLSVQFQKWKTVPKCFGFVRTINHVVTESDNDLSKMYIAFCDSAIFSPRTFDDALQETWYINSTVLEEVKTCTEMKWPVSSSSLAVLTVSYYTGINPTNL